MFGFLCFAPWVSTFAFSVSMWSSRKCPCFVEQQPWLFRCQCSLLTWVLVQSTQGSDLLLADLGAPRVLSTLELSLPSSSFAAQGGCRPEDCQTTAKSFCSICRRHMLDFVGTAFCKLQHWSKRQTSGMHVPMQLAMSANPGGRQLTMSLDLNFAGSLLDQCPNNCTRPSCHLTSVHTKQPQWELAAAQVPFRRNCPRWWRS